AEILNRMLLEVLGHLKNFAVGQTGIRFPDVQQLTILAHSERIVGKDIAPASMPKLDTSDDDIECRQRFFPFQPRHAALARCVDGIGALEHQAFVPSSFGFRKEWLERLPSLDQMKRRQIKSGRPLDTRQELLTFRKRIVDESFTVGKQ